MPPKIKLIILFQILPKYFLSSLFAYKSREVFWQKVISTKATQKYWQNWLKVYISPTFYKHFFVQKWFADLFCAYILGFVNFWQKEIGKKSALKMLAKFATGIYFTNILQSFACISVLWSFFVFLVQVCNFLARGNQCKSFS